MLHWPALENPGDECRLSPQVVPITAAGLQGEQPLVNRTMLVREVETWQLRCNRSLAFPSTPPQWTASHQSYPPHTPSPPTRARQKVRFRQSAFSHILRRLSGVRLLDHTTCQTGHSDLISPRLPQAKDPRARPYGG